MDRHADAATKLLLKCPKLDRKKMSVVGSVYNIDRFERTSEEVVEALSREPGKPRVVGRRPRPRHKRIEASLNYVTQEIDSIRAAPAGRLLLDGRRGGRS